MQAEENHLEQKDCQGAAVPGAGAREHGGGELEPESGPLTHFRLSGLSGEGAWPPLSPHGPHTLGMASVGQGLSTKLPRGKWGKSQVWHLRQTGNPGASLGVFPAYTFLPLALHRPSPPGALPLLLGWPGQNDYLTVKKRRTV